MNTRTIRVFLSSTFRDFAEERDLLVKNVFPELRRKCRERAVELVDVDLRWGITEEEAQQGKVLPICLAEIDRSRPYFIGFLGERYGWVPEAEQYDRSVLIEQPWLEQHCGGKSVTELEILHGVLDNPAMEKRAFFYFRDPAWSEAKGGAYLAEGPAEQARLAELKERIRQSGFPVVENYANPEELAERVRVDLWHLIDEAYPESEVPDALALEGLRHEAYGAAKSRLCLSLKGGNSEQFIENFLTDTSHAQKPILITGETGSGKTTLVVNVLKNWRERYPKDVLFIHHFGATTDSMEPENMILRLIAMLQDETSEVMVPDTSKEEILEQFPDVLEAISRNACRCQRRWILVLDGLGNTIINSLKKNIKQNCLKWVPRTCPDGIRILVTCTAGKLSEQLLSDYWLDDGQGYLRRTAPDWLILNIDPLDENERIAFITSHLNKFSKSLPEELVNRILAHPLSGRPVWLITLLEEIRVFGIHEKLVNRMDILLSNPTSKPGFEAPKVDDLFEHVLARLSLENDTVKSAEAFKALWAEPGGMTESALIDFSGLSPSSWAAIRNSLDENLIETMGKIRLGTSYLNKAVANLWLSNMDCRSDIHIRLSKWYRNQEPNFTNLRCALRQLIKTKNTQLIWDYMCSLWFLKLLPHDEGGLLCFFEGFEATGMSIDDFFEKDRIVMAIGKSEYSALFGKLESLRRHVSVLSEVMISFDETRRKIREIEKREGKSSKPTRIRKLEDFIELPDSEPRAE